MTILSSLSRIVALVEIAVAALLTVATTGLILLNIVTRTSGNALYWVDEAAISTMVWASFLGASAAIERRSAVAVTLLPDAMPERWRYRLRLWSDFLVLVFFAILMWLCFLWFDPLTLYRADFSLSDFTSETFNFIYQETTTTLGVPKFWLWGVMPVFAVFGTLHALARLLERGLASQEAPEPEADHPETLRCYPSALQFSFSPAFLLPSCWR